MSACISLSTLVVCYTRVKKSSFCHTFVLSGGVIFSKRVLKCTEPGTGHDHTSIDRCCTEHSLLQGVSNWPAEGTGVSPSVSQMVPLAPVRRPKAGSCSSSSGGLAVASQQIRLHFPSIYTLLILSGADSADAQLPQRLEEYQLSPVQHKEIESLHVSRRNIS